MVHVGWENTIGFLNKGNTEKLKTLCLREAYSKSAMSRWLESLRPSQEYS